MQASKFLLLLLGNILASARASDLKDLATGVGREIVREAASTTGTYLRWCLQEAAACGLSDEERERVRALLEAWPRESRRLGLASDARFDLPGQGIRRSALTGNNIGDTVFFNEAHLCEEVLAGRAYRPIAFATAQALYLHELLHHLGFRDEPGERPLDALGQKLAAFLEKQSQILRVPQSEAQLRLHSPAYRLGDEDRAGPRPHLFYTDSQRFFPLSQALWELYPHCPPATPVLHRLWAYNLRWVEPGRVAELDLEAACRSQEKTHGLHSLMHLENRLRLEIPIQGKPRLNFQSAGLYTGNLLGASHPLKGKVRGQQVRDGLWQVELELPQDEQAPRAASAFFHVTEPDPLLPSAGTLPFDQVKLEGNSLQLETRLPDASPILKLGRVFIQHPNSLPRLLQLGPVQTTGEAPPSALSLRRLSIVSDANDFADANINLKTAAPVEKVELLFETDHAEALAQALAPLYTRKTASKWLLQKNFTGSAESFQFRFPLLGLGVRPRKLVLAELRVIDAALHEHRFDLRHLTSAER